MKLKRIVSTTLALALGLSFSTSVFASEEKIMKEYLTEIPDNKPVKSVDVQSKIDYGYEDILLAKIKEFEEKYPQASEDEINAHFMKLIEEYDRNNKELDIKPKEFKDTTEELMVGIQSSSNFIYEVVGGKCNLNSHEQSLFNENPTRGFQACVAGKEAQDYAIYKFGYNGRNDKTDAFRHSSWNILIVGFTGSVGWAKSWTDAHETGALDNPPIEFNMDIHNNTEGRKKAISDNISTSSSITSVRSSIDQLYRSGSLQHIVNNSRVYFTGKTSDYVN